MKRLIQTICFLILLLPATAQQTQTDSIKRAREREIKTSGLYLYGEAVHEKKSEAVKTAKSILTSEINKEILSRPNWQFAKQIEAKDVEYTTDHIDLLRGSRVRVIAYIKKDSLQAIFDKSAPNVKLSDKPEKTEKKEKKEKPKKEMGKLVQPGDNPQETTPPLSDDTSANASENKETPKPESTNISILDDLLTAKDVNQASVLLTKYNRLGKLVYGKPGTNLAPHQSYLMVYNKQGNIVAILDKGSDNERTNLMNGEKATLQSFPSTTYIWFQLYD